MLRRVATMLALCVSLATYAMPVLAGSGSEASAAGTVIIGQINNADDILYESREVYFITYYFGDFWVSLPEEAGPLADLVGCSYRLTLAEPRNAPFELWGSEHVAGASLERLESVSGMYVETGEDYLLVSLHEGERETIGIDEMRFLVDEATESTRIYNPGDDGIVIYEELEDGTLHALCVTIASG